MTSDWASLPVLGVETGHVVSGSMVDRAYLVDQWRGLLAQGPDGRLWLVTTEEVLAPDLDAMLRRGRAAGGPPVNSARLALTKIKLDWPGAQAGASAEVANPKVAPRPDGCGFLVVPLSRAKGLAELVEAGISEGAGPVPYRVDPEPIQVELPDPALGSLLVAGYYEDDAGGRWPTARSARVASDPSGGFAGIAGGVALDIVLTPAETGSPVYRDGPGGPVLVGLARPVSSSMAVLLPADRINEAVLTAGQDLDPRPGSG